MGFYLHHRNHIPIFLSILITLFISSALGLVNELPSSQLTTVSAIHPVDVDVSVVLRPVPPVASHETFSTLLRTIFGDITGVSTTDIHISGVERKGPCSLEREDEGPGRRRLQQRWVADPVLGKQTSRNLLIEFEAMSDGGVEAMCWRKVGLEDASIQATTQPIELNVTLTIRTEDRNTVADRILLAKHTGVLAERLSEAGLKDGVGDLSVVVESDAGSSPQQGIADGMQKVQVSILIAQTSAYDLTTETIEALKAFLASSTGVPLDAIIVEDVKREIALGGQSSQATQTVDQTLVDLNVTFALSTAEPGYVMTALWEAARNGLLNEIIDGAELRVLNSKPGADLGIPRNSDDGQAIGGEPYHSRNSMSWWQVLLLVVGGFTMLIVPFCAGYLNKSRIRNFSIPKAPASNRPPTKEGVQSADKPQSLELPSGGSQQDNGKIQSFLSVLGSKNDSILPSPYGGRNAMQLDASMDRYEAKPQWRTTQKPMPLIRDISTDSDSAEVLSDSFSDYDLVITPTGAQLKPSDPHIETTQDLFFTMSERNIQTPTSEGGSKRSLDADRSSGEGTRRVRRSDASVSDYLSADDGEEFTLPPFLAPPSATVRHVELTASVDLPPSPCSLQSARARDSPVKSGPRVPRLFTSVLDSSDLEYDAPSVDVPGQGLSQFQYRAYDQEPHGETYNRQYVNYLFDAPPSTSRTSRSDATSPSALSGNNGYRLRN